MPHPIHPSSYAIYNRCFVPLALLGYNIIARKFSAKAKRGLEGRRELLPRFEIRREELRGAVWFHAASVGEYEQARPVLRALRKECHAQGLEIPTLQTVFSPSGYDFARDRSDADVVDYLPLDTASAMNRMIEMIRPRAVVFLKFDCWPNLIWAARRANVPVLLLDATLHRRSYRLRGIARSFFGHLFDCFHAIGAISEDDAERFRHGLSTSAPVTVTGDTRSLHYSHRWKESEGGRLATALAEAPFAHLALGSIWPADEEVVLDPAIQGTLAAEDRGLILVPHEPTPAALARLDSVCAAKGLATSRLSELFDLSRGTVRIDPAADPERWRCILVDGVGVLAEIYRSVAFTYVGGSFSTGVHNVLEPAVCGQPVLFGPLIHNAYEAERLVELGAGFIIGNSMQARERFENFFGDESRRRHCGQLAQNFVLDQSGATEASLAILRPFLSLEPPVGSSLTAEN